MKTKLCSNCGCTVYKEEVNCPDCGAVVFQSKNKKEEIQISKERLEVGDIVQHFKRETLSEEELHTHMYLYQILTIAEHTEIKNEKLVIYRALYGPNKVYARPYDMFMGRVDKKKYPSIKAEFRFEKVLYN